jgi:hypothetical protein
MMHAISISDAHAFGPCLLTSGHLDFECDTCFMDESVWTGIHVDRTVAAIFPNLLFRKEILKFGRTLSVIQTGS